MAPRDDLAHCGQSLLVQFGRLWLARNHSRIFNVFQIAKHGKGDEAVFVVWTLIHRVLNLVSHYADHFKIQSPNTDPLSHGWRALECLFCRVVAEDYDPVMLKKVSFVEV